LGSMMWSDKLEKASARLKAACDQNRACDHNPLSSSVKNAVTKSLLTKNSVARAFSRAAHTYDAHAFVQQHSANVLMRHFADQCYQLNTPLRLLDLGCGTGLMISDLINMAGPQGQVIAADLSDGMLEVAAQRCSDHLESRFECQLEFQQLDAETLPFYEPVFDGIYSNLMVQWCDLSKVLYNCCSILKPQGVAALSTLIEGTLTELTSTWSHIDQAQHVNRFLSKARLMQQAQAAGYRCYFETRTLYYASVKAIFMALKGIGANWVQTDERMPLTKHKWQALQQAYEVYRTDQGLPLSYQIAYLVHRASE
jgi:malonyl-CoA O-methyltransferase